MKPAPAPEVTEIALLTHEYAPFRGGAATLTREVAGAISELGNSEVWAPDYRISPDQLGPSVAFRIRRWPNRGTLAPWNVGRLAWDLAHEAAGLRPWRLALLSVGALRAALWVQLLRPHALPGRITVVFHGSEILKMRRSAFWSDRLRRAFAGGWRPACTTRVVEDLLREADWVGTGCPVVRLPCALPEHLRVPAAAAENERPGGGPGDAAFRLLTLARWHPRKGQLDVARALALLPPDERARIRWVVGGTGDFTYKAETVAVAAAAGIAVEDHGEVAEAGLAGLYRGCHAYVMASRSLPESIEGFGLTFLEAGAFGLPVVGTQTGGVAEAVEDGVTGWLVPEGDPAALSAALGRLLREPALARRLGQAGRARALAGSWRDAAENLLGERILC